MTDEKYTRCPECRTVYRVTEAQLALRAGRVRCGQCQAVFDGFAELVAVGPPEPDQDPDWSHAAPSANTAGSEGAFDERELTYTYGESAEFAAAADREAAATSARSPATAVDPVAEPAVEAGPSIGPPPAEGTAASGPGEPSGAQVPGEASTATTATAAVASAAAAGGRRSAGARRPGLAAQIAYAVLGGLLAILLLAQGAYHFRDQLAARWPVLTPALVQACQKLACTVGAPRNVADLAIEASDLQADPAHQGLLILSATLRNRGSTPLAYPLLELSLTDAQDQVVVRRVLTPADYAGGTIDLDRGLPANSDLAIKLFIDASATSQAGYRLYVFYG